MYERNADEYVTAKTAMKCAKRDLDAVCGDPSKHFEAGFTQAYRDLAEGRLATVPPVPPSKYWTAYYRSCAGQADVADWFAGYEAGLNSGLQSGVSRFNRITASRGGCPPHGSPAYGMDATPVGPPLAQAPPSPPATRWNHLLQASGTR
jgi:hypothetical protein